MEKNYLSYVTCSLRTLLCYQSLSQKEWYLKCLLGTTNIDNENKLQGLNVCSSA